jgi:hypothetical protein
VPIGLLFRSIPAQTLKMSAKKIKGTLMEIVIITIAWLTALSLLYVLVLKLKLLNNFFH